MLTAQKETKVCVQNPCLARGLSVVLSKLVNGD